MLTFALCPHDTEQKKELEFWQNFAKSISEKLEEDVKIITFKDYAEEKIKLPDADYDIYYANPVSSYFLYEKGYKPLARLKGKKDSFVIIGYENIKNHHRTVTTTYIETHILPILELKEFDFLKTKIFFVRTQKEIYESVKNKKADFGIMFEDTYNEIEDKEKVPVILKIPSNLRHTLMVKPENYEKIKEMVKEFNEFEIIDEKDFIEGITEKLPIISFLKTKEFFDILKAIYNTPFVGVLIYKDKIVYSNETFQKLTGYTLEELQHLSTEDLVAPEYKEKIKEVVKRRLKGEFFSKGYENLKVKTKDGRYLYTLAFSNTILYENSYAGLVFLVDITKEVLYQKLYKALRNINRAITTALTEEQLYKKVCETLVKEFDIKFVWIGIPDEKTKTFKSVYKCGEEQDYLKHVKIYAGGNIPEAKGQTGRAYKEGKIVINPSTEETPFMKPWKEEMLKRGFLSSAAIPIMKNGKVHAVLNIYASIPYFFEDTKKNILEELKHDLSFALEKINLIKESLILKNAVEKSTEWILITDKNGNIEYINDYVSNLTGYKKEELIGKNPRIFKSGYNPKEFYEKLWKTILSGNEFEGVFVNRKKNGEIFYIEEKIIPVELPDGEIKFVSIGRDITKETELLKENERLKYYDVLTGLYNFNGFAAQVEDYIVKNPESLAAFILIDIANFSYINKTYGQDLGDELLKQIAKSLKEHFKKEDIIGRVGGDEFAVFVKDLKEKNDLFSLIERIKNILDRDTIFRIDDIDINLSIHGGISVYPDDGKTFKELMQNASVALKEAKKEGENIVKVYNKEIEESIKSFFSIESLLNKAVKENLFVFHYQPYFNAKTKEIKGFEALVRIKDKEGNLYYPNEFIDFLENSHYLDYFRKWALNEVSQKIKKWKKPISLNISARTFKNHDFPKQVFSYAKDLPAPLILEITERLYMDEPEKSEKIIENLKECKNIKIAIDDFGTGYSSLSYLKDINADILKIDISFVRAMVEDKKSQAIVKAIITLAKALNMKTLAEGVETKEQYEMLKNMEVDYIQGFYFSKPLSEEEAEKLLK